MSEFGSGHRGIELHKRIAGFYALAVVDVDGANDAGLERLNDLSAAARDDFAWSDSDNIDGAEYCPNEADAEDRNHDISENLSDRGRRCLHNL